MDVISFEEAFAATAKLDGLIFKFDTHDEQHRQIVCGKLRTMLVNACPLPEDDMKRSFKVNVYWMDKQRARAIVKVGVYGPLLRAIEHLPASLIANVFEAHFKSWAADGDESLFREFCSRTVWASGGRQATQFGQKANPNSNKGSGFGLRVGDRNSDYSFVFYRRRGQNVGLEARIKDRACYTRCIKALDIVSRTSSTDSEAWETALAVLAGAAGSMFERELRVKNEKLEWVAALVGTSDAHADAVKHPFSFDGPPDPEVQTWVAQPFDM
jgi:hypothetical protein